MEGLKCSKCGFVNETYQRGALITGTRCLSCGYETLSKVCNNVGELKEFFEKVSNGVAVFFGDDLANLKIEAHFEKDIGRTERIKIWRGNDK